MYTIGNIIKLLSKNKAINIKNGFRKIHSHVIQNYRKFNSLVSLNQTNYLLII